MLFELVTPEKLLFSGEASYVHAPGSDGDFGVLDGHMPLIATLREDAEAKVETQDGNKTFKIGSGFIEVTSHSVTLLAESAEEVGA